MRVTHFFLYSSLCVVALIAYGMFLAPRAAAITIPDTSAGVPDFDASVQLFGDYIVQHGGVAAYRAFANAVAPLAPGRQHSLAHAFGRALYAQGGLGSLTVCDSRFSYGCFHEFLGQAIAHEGLVVVDELNQRCVDVLGKNSLSCQHGIGHGIEAYMGYTEGDVKKALAICRHLPFNDPIGGCYGGVFMEYNLETMRNTGSIRPLVARDFQAPCTTLDQDYKPACYFWQPQWWAQVLRPEVGDNMFDLYTRVGLLCQKVPEEYKRNCFEGTGTNLPADAHFNPSSAKALCETVSQSPLDQLYCKSMAANSLTVGGSGEVANGVEVCDGLSGELYDYCNAYAKNEANIADTRAQPAL